MDRLDVISVADSVNDASTPAEAWRRFAAVLARHGLTRTALHAGLPLKAPNPFAYDRCERAFGDLWDEALDKRLRSFAGDVRRTDEPDLLGLKPTLIYLSLFRTPLFVDHGVLMNSPKATAVGPLSRLMIERFGQYQMVVFPLMDPKSGEAAILSAFGDEDRRDFTVFVKQNLDALHMAGHFFLALVEARWPDNRVEAASSKSEIGQALSDRERQVLTLFAGGAQTAEVADRLILSERSVREYVSRARRKLGARSRSAAIAKAMLAGMIG